MITASKNKKQTLRQHFRELRRNLSVHDKQLAANKIAQELVKHPVYQKAQHIGVYSALPEEVSLEPFCELAWQDKKSLYLPVIDNESRHNQMHFQHWDSNTQMKANSLGISEPCPTAKSTHANARFPHLDLLLLPLVAYDKTGRRLGMGAGFYDRYIEAHLNTDCLLMGIAFSCQQADVLPHETWDKNLHAVLNEKKLIVFTD